MSNSGSFLPPFSSSSSQHGVDVQPHQHLIQFHLHLQQPGPSQTLQFSTEQVVQNCGAETDQTKVLKTLPESTPTIKAGSVSLSKEVYPAPSISNNTTPTASTTSAPCQQIQGKKQKRRERRTNWKDGETFLLLESWRRHYRTLIDGSSYNEKRRIWGEIYDTFIHMCEESSIEKSDWEYEQVRKRIKNLQYEFKVLQPKVLDSDPERAASLRKGFPYYDALERITDTNISEDKAPLKEAACLLDGSSKLNRPDIELGRAINLPTVDIEPLSPPSPRSPITRDMVPQQGGRAGTSSLNSSPSHDSNSLNNPFGAPYTVIAAPPPQEEDSSHEITSEPGQEGDEVVGIAIKQEKTEDTDENDTSVQRKRQRKEATLLEKQDNLLEDNDIPFQPPKRRRVESLTETESSSEDLLSVFQDMRDMWKEALKRRQEQHNEMIQVHRDQTRVLLCGLKDIFQDMFKQ